jgi:photosystem II stability/assembly factor-like uncharacterized protein
MKNSPLRRRFTFIVFLVAVSILYFSCKKNTTASITPPKIHSFTSNPGTINQGDSSTLSWSVDAASSLAINGEMVTGSNKIVTPGASTEYTLVATNLDGSVNAKTTVTVNIPPPPIDTLGSGWKKISYIDSSNLADIFFINNTGFAIGSLILKSSDGGNTWSQIAMPSGVSYLFNMGMGNEMNAIFLSSQGQPVSTRDGGLSFTISTLPDIIGDVFFVDATTAYAAGTNIWKTTDAGSNWVKLYSSIPGRNYTSSLYFLNAQIGWALRDVGLYQSVNAGVDWSVIPTPFGNSRNMAIYFLNSDTGYISGIINGYGTYGSVKRTMDGGASWTSIFTTFAVPYMDIHFVSDKTGYITDGTRIYKTEDGGNTWTSEVHLVSSTLIELHFSDPDHGWACGADGTILRYSR